MPACLTYIRWPNLTWYHLKCPAVAWPVLTWYWGAAGPCCRGSDSASAGCRPVIMWLKHHHHHHYHHHHLLLLLMPILLASLLAPRQAAANSDASRLYDDLLSNYNKLVRPVVNNTDKLQVFIKLKLSQLIDVVSNWLLLRAKWRGKCGT